MQKRLFLFLFLVGLIGFTPSVVHAADTTYYVDSVNGLDTKDGKSEANAWKTLDFAMTKANTFTPGDKLLLKRGQTFACGVGYTISSSGTTAKPLTLGSYGTADRPIVKCIGTVPVSMFHFTGSYWNVDGVELDNDQLDPLIINGKTIPKVSHVYNALWLSGNNIAVNNVRVRHVTEGISPQGLNESVTNSEVAELYPYTDGGVNGIPRAFYLTDSLSSVKISNNWIHDIIGPDRDNALSGHAFVINGQVNQGTVDKNFVENIYQFAEIGPTNVANQSIANIKFQYNVIKNVRRLAYFHSTGPSNITVAISNISFENNSLRNDMSVNLDYAFQWTGNASPVQIYVRNNIFAFPTVSKWVDSFAYTHQNNLYYIPDGQDAPGSIASLPLSTGELRGNPQFRVGLRAYAFTTLPTSPAINSGLNLGVPSDYFGTPVPFTAGQVDIGAIEYKADDLVYCRADIDKSTFVDVGDFSKLAANFFRSTSQLVEPRADIDQSGFVDLSDYSILISQFFTACDPSLTVGVNAAWFDPGNNEKVINLVKSKAKLKAPITVLADVNADDYTLSTKLLWNAGQASSLVMLRIVGIDKNTTIAQVQALRDRLNTASFYPDVPTLVVLGNEVNNLDAEWKLCAGTTCPQRTAEAGTAYGNLFKAFSNGAKFTAVPAPLDQYNGVYPDWQGFVNAAGVYGVGQTLVANVYDLNPNDPSDTQVWKQYQGNVVAFTEYGPHPTNFPLASYLDWYKNNPSPVPATTLVPNTCGGESWLYYIMGSIYNSNGQKIDPTNCQIIN